MFLVDWMAIVSLEKICVNFSEKQNALPLFLIPGGSVVKKSACQSTRHRFDPWVRKIPWSRKWQVTPVFLPGESHGRGAWWVTVHGVAKESDTTY